MQDSEVGHPYWELFVGMSLILVNQAVARAIHRLEAHCLHSIAILVLHQEQVFLVVLVVTGDLPQVYVGQIWRDYFLITSFLILIPHKIHQRVVDFGPIRQEERAAW